MTTIFMSFQIPGPLDQVRVIGTEPALQAGMLEILKEIAVI
jgi:hypothetical protein